MDTLEALRAISEVAESQWGLVTSAQARSLGLSHMNLSRMAAAGDLERVAHGIYRETSVPSDEHEALRAAWLAIDPSRFAHERLSDTRTAAVVSGESAAALHQIGNFRASKSEFTTAARKQTQRPDIRYRTLELPDVDVTLKEGLPVTTRERTIADLVEANQDLSLVGDTLADALRQSQLETGRLTELLTPLAKRKGFAEGDGEALLAELGRIAGVDLEALAERILSMPDLAQAVFQRHLDKIFSIQGAQIGVESARVFGETRMPVSMKNSPLAIRPISEVIVGPQVPSPSQKVVEPIGKMLVDRTELMGWTAITKAFEDNE